jgi:cytochrome P450 family 130
MTSVRAGKPPKALATEEPDVVRGFSTTAIDPAAHYAALRDKCPVALQSGGAGSNGGSRSAWLITRYEDIVEMSKNADTFGQSIRFVERRRPPLESNPPEHRAWRSLLQPFFMPKTIAWLEPISNEIVSELLVPLVAAGGGEFAHGVARPLPPQVLLSWMRQPREDWERIKQCCESAYLQGSTDPKERALYEESDAYLWDYSRRAVDARVNGDYDRTTDPIAALVGGISEDGPITYDLIVGAIRLILAAGHDSTTSAVGICLQYVAENPDLQDVLRQNPKQIANAIEEILRLRAPVIQMPRTVMKDTELRGRKLAEDDAALLIFASGNLDEAAFPNASEFKLDRMPNRHLSFGTGIHTCIGNILARQEIRVTLEQLLARTKSFRLAGSTHHEFWHPYGATVLPLELEAA